ncbi:hypothetical protein C8Q77DRAFT_292120 [Trametes polyzona]|nr:hypothetical protein C8Q77DRAFT_292120 [Trametes polyzona]
MDARNTEEPLRHVFSPDPLWYAVIRIDPMATVKALDDPVATAAAQAMSTKPYLVFLRRVRLGLPFPNKPWYRYTISVIAPCVRDPHEAKGYTPDMCVPIYPNTSHPTDRRPVRPEEPFPFHNCYHWLEMDMDVRVLARPEWFDRHKAIKLSSDEEYEMDMFWSLDHTRILDERDAALSAMIPAVGSPSTPPAQPSSPLPEPDTTSPVDISDRDTLSDARSATTHSLSESCSSRSSMNSASTANSVERIMRMDIFSGPNDDVALLPLCELWEDLSAHFKSEEDIPHPSGLFKERDEIAKIVRDARIRAYSATTAAGLVRSTDERAIGSEGQGVERVRRPFPHVGFGLRTAARKLHLRVKSIVASASARFPIPYIPVWP